MLTNYKEEPKLKIQERTLDSHILKYLYRFPGWTTVEIFQKRLGLKPLHLPTLNNIKFKGNLNVF